MNMTYQQHSRAFADRRHTPVDGTQSTSAALECPGHLYHSGSLPSLPERARRLPPYPPSRRRRRR
ncbi:MAG: hypothetical protein H0W02_22140 [Ktedonobacteraceae bacterium]|nr:hypothetical protein [Ktedonobacteraceae bacterium]